MCDSRGRCLHLSTRTSQEKVLALSSKPFQVLSSSSQTTFFEEQMTDLLLIKYFRLKYCQWVLIASVLSMWVIPFGDPSKCVCDMGGSGRTQWKIGAPCGIDWISFPFWLKVGACIVSQDRVILGKVTQNSWFLHIVCNCTNYYHVSYNTCNQ